MSVIFGLDQLTRSRVHSRAYTTVGCLPIKSHLTYRRESFSSFCAHYPLLLPFGCGECTRASRPEAPDACHCQGHAILAIQML